MDQETDFVIYEGIVVPESAMLRMERGNRYGDVAELEDEQPAEPEELERQVVLEQWGPVLRLPSKTRGSAIIPAVDENGGLDWGAFGTVDFERCWPEFDKLRYKADKLREALKDVLIMLDIVRARIPGRAKYKVLKQLKLGVIKLEQIQHEDMHALGKLYLRALRMRREIAELEEASWTRKQQELDEWLASLG